ncbi:hypothetical protein F0562_004899 [Nyssa sinensis]|uniref:Uncharacterized protein n=1 Tax=Nyssa sinensis TaxID=561372 RepID=A0A5J5AHY2_9ASTE|nr:hypothetical protein F0562_004899 [Nyssa sinensis]
MSCKVIGNRLESSGEVYPSASDSLQILSWPHRYELHLRISLSAGKLTLIPCVRNMDNKAFSFTFALHNYLCLSDIR